MFEYEEHTVKELLDSSERFRQLYQQHADLKIQVREAEIGIHQLDDLALSRLKRRKLLAKDKMAHMMQRYHRETA